MNPNLIHATVCAVFLDTVAVKFFFNSLWFLRISQIDKQSKLKKLVVYDNTCGPLRLQPTSLSPRTIAPGPFVVHHSLGTNVVLNCTSRDSLLYEFVAFDDGAKKSQRICFLEKYWYCNGKRLPCASCLRILAEASKHSASANYNIPRVSPTIILLRTCANR